MEAKGGRCDIRQVRRPRRRRSRMVLASLIAFVVVALVGFFGIGLIGLIFWFICTRVELESDGGASLFAAQYRTQQEMMQSERASYRHEQSLVQQSVRFFKNVGVGLTIMGFGGFLYDLGAFGI